MKTDPNESQVKILIVEDSPTQAEKLKFILEQDGYVFSIVRNGREAVDAIRAEPPTLVISDIVMPEMDGYELCHWIKADDKLKTVPVILLTSLSDPADVMKGLESGADSFIVKPYDEQYLLARIAYILANRHLRESESPQMGVEIFFAGRKFFITSDRLQILNLLLSTYEAAIQKNRELARAQEELKNLNDHLEATNKELEAFSFSVSHDLRAPLRAVNGFSHILMTKFSGILPPEAANLLNNVTKSGKRMEELIDDLLNLSRMGRQPLVKQSFQLSQLVQQVLSELSSEREGRNLEVRLGELPGCIGDPSLLKQVYINLISNAFKFTRKTEQAIVEIGTWAKPSELVCFVRDNGAGFDMQFAQNLFGVFQRLHRASEFEGTGIGLSIVQRIIHRHGGRIWAEAAVDQGAKFYFTLPYTAAKAGNS